MKWKEGKLISKINFQQRNYDYSLNSTCRANLPHRSNLWTGERKVGTKQVKQPDYCKGIGGVPVNKTLEESVDSRRLCRYAML